MKRYRSLTILGAAAALLLTMAWKGNGDVTSVFEPLTFNNTPVRNDATLQLVTTAPAPAIFLTHAGDDRLFVTLRDGRIVILDNGAFRSEPFLDLRGLVGQEGEGGLLSVAFHPRYSENGFFFVNYTDPGVANTVIARYRVSGTDANRADPASRRVLLTIAQPFTNHNGGQLQFGPDGFLYIGMGDGGSANDPQCRAQRDDTLLGKMLRIDVDQNIDTAPFYGIPADNPFRGPGGMPDEVWASGLRNPWRFSFDRETGDLWTADVGQNAVEEIDRQPAGQGGLNYGWKVMEGSRCFSTSACPASTPPCNSPALTLPVLEYEHGNGRCSVTGGYVYRGPQVPQLRGDYVFGDLCSGEVWTATPAGASFTVRRVSETLPQLATFGEDRNGELYVIRLTGQIYRFAGNSTPPPPPPGRADTVGLFDPEPSRFLLKNRNVSGPIDRTVRFGRPRSRWVPLAGDWNGDGVTTIGFYDPATGIFRLKNSLTGGNADIVVSLAADVPRAADTIPVVGDWDGNGQDSLGFYDRVTHTFRLKNQIAGPSVPFDQTTTINMGPLSQSGRYLPVMGDWDGDGDDTPGLFDPETGRFVYVNGFDPGTFSIVVQYAIAGRWLAVAGDWNGDGRDGLGLYDPARGVFRLDNNLDRVPDVLVRIPNGRNKLPLAGAW
ncbi:MAG TPA: PQQ-dependent sugar dehydrogenase [Thermoanaerobaculia bacterium]|nr:PQQ-dependent sugar dehydrogenase [Thermoanaerobaculia bacterium]